MAKLSWLSIINQSKFAEGFEKSILVLDLTLSNKLYFTNYISFLYAKCFDSSMKTACNKCLLKSVFNIPGHFLGPEICSLRFALLLTASFDFE